MSFSDELEAWLKRPGPKTILGLNDFFGHRSFAVVFLLLMFIPALPLPTGGITHIFEIVTMLLAVELIAGRQNIWLPKRWHSFELGKVSQTKTVPFLIRRVRWFERLSRPRLRSWVKRPYFFRLAGLFIVVFTLAAFLAPPFSALDTLPSLAVVLIALALIFEDIIFFIAGIASGFVGMGLIIALGSLVSHLVI